MHEPYDAFDLTKTDRWHPFTEDFSLVDMCGGAQRFVDMLVEFLYGHEHTVIEQQQAQDETA